MFYGYHQNRELSENQSENSVKQKAKGIENELHVGAAGEEKLSATQSGLSAEHIACWIAIMLARRN